MDAISSYNGNRPTNTQTHRQDRLQYNVQLSLVRSVNIVKHVHCRTQTIRSSCSALSSRAPANTSTKLVPSPHSCSCCCDANTSIFAAGCCTYNNIKTHIKHDVNPHNQYNIHLPATSKITQPSVYFDTFLLLNLCDHTETTCKHDECSCLSLTSAYSPYGK